MPMPFTIAEHRTAQAPVLQQLDGVVAVSHQRVVEADLPEFVDHCQAASQRGIEQRAIQEGCLAAAQKAGKNRHGRADVHARGLPGTRRARLCAHDHRRCGASRTSRIRGFGDAK